MDKIPLGTEKIPPLKEVEHGVQTCIDTYIGVDVIKKINAGNNQNHRYIPQGSKETDESYRLRMDATTFKNYFAPSLSLFSGKITEKGPIITGLEDLNTEDVDMEGNTLLAFIKETLTDSLISGVSFVAVESRPEQKGVYLKRLKYIDLISFKREENKLTELTFKQKRRVFKNEKFHESDIYVRYRIGGGTIYVKGAAEYSWKNNLDILPVVPIITGRKREFLEYTPEFLDLAMENLTLLACVSLNARITVNTSSPTPCFFGNFSQQKFEDADGDLVNIDEIELGAETSLYFEGDRGKTGLVYSSYPEGSHIGIQETIKNAEKNCESMSMNILNRTRYHTVKDSEDNSNKSSPILSSFSMEMEHKFSQILTIMFRMMGRDKPDNAKIEFQKDFEDKSLKKETADLLKVLIIGGKISRKLAIHLVDQQKAFGENFNIEEELQRTPMYVEMPKYEEKQKPKNEEKRKESLFNRVFTKK